MRGGRCLCLRGECEFIFVFGLCFLAFFGKLGEEMGGVV